MLMETELLSLQKYGGNYFSFVIVGVALMQYFNVSLSTFAGTVRRDQMAGCLESIMSSSTSTQTVIILSALYTFTVKSIHIVIIFAVGSLFLENNLNLTNLPSVLITVFLTIAVFASFGDFCCCNYNLFKKG